MRCVTWHSTKRDSSRLNRIDQSGMHTKNYSRRYLRTASTKLWMRRNVRSEGVHMDFINEDNETHQHVCEYNSTLEQVVCGTICIITCCQIRNPLSDLRGWNEGKSKWRGQDNPRRGIEEPGGKAAVWQAIARTASYPYHNPNEIDILIPTRSSAICGCEGSQITASYRAAGRRGSRVPNRQVMSLRARPLSYIGENANSCIKSSFGNGWFLLFFSLSTYGQFPFITICIQDYLIHFITTLRVLDWGGVLEYYIFIVQSSFPFVTLLITVTDFLYLVFGLCYIPYGLHSCRSLSFVIFLHFPTLPNHRATKHSSARLIHL